MHGVLELQLPSVPVSLKAREARRGHDAERDEVVRQLNAARDAGDRERAEELLARLERIDFGEGGYVEQAAEPMGMDEREYLVQRAASGVEDSVDARPIPRSNVRDSFHPPGWYRPRLERRRLRPRRAPLAEALYRRVSRRAPRPRRVAGSRSSSKDPPSPSGEPELARRLYGAARCWLDATGLRPWSGWKRLAIEARAGREREWAQLAAREAGFVHVSELIEDELGRLGSLR